MTEFLARKNTLHLHHKDHPVNAVVRDNLCLLFPGKETCIRNFGRET